MTCAQLYPEFWVKQGEFVAHQNAEVTPAKRLLRKNKFTVCHVSRHPDADDARVFLDENMLLPRDDILLQRDVIKRQRHAYLQEKINAIELSNQLSGRERAIALVCLVRHAAKRAVHHARMSNCAPAVLQCVCETWQAFLRQAYTYLGGGEPGGVQKNVNAQDLEHCCRGALGIISSLGIWFDGSASLPFRRYLIRWLTAIGGVTFTIVTGLVSFAYSTYITDDRRRAQKATLAELKRLSTGLGINIYFLPALISPGRTRSPDSYCHCNC